MTDTRHGAIRIAAVLVMLIASALPDAQARAATTTPRQETGLAPDQIASWRGDVTALEKLLVERHCDVDRFNRREVITRGAERLRARIPELARHEVIVEMSMLVAALGDGHSSLRWSRDDFPIYPFWGHWFSDGYYVLDARAPNEDLVGKRIVRFGDMDLEQVLDRLSPVVSAENESFAKWLLNGRVRLAPLLHVRGVLPSPERGRFTVVGEDGVELTRELEAISIADYDAWAEGRDRTLWRESLAESKWYSFRLLEQERTLLVDFASCRDQPGEETVLEFADRLREFIAENEFERFVLDLRSNGGGSANNTIPLVRLMATDPRVNRSGRVFVLVSANTYSAAVLMCGMLENRTKAVFVGEPAGQGVNLFGDASMHDLPFSGLRVSVSERWWQCSVPEDERRWIAIDVPAPRTYADFRTGHDPGLDAVHSYRHVAPTPSPLAAAEADRLVGRFLFSPWQELVIARKGEGLAFRIHDKIDGPAWLAEVSSDLVPVEDHFVTDIRDVVLQRPAAGEERVASVAFDWRGVRKECERLEPTYRFPMELADGGNVSGGALGPDFPMGPNDAPGEIDERRVVEGLLALEARPDLYRLRTLLEQRLNIAGYRFLRSGNADLAVRIFETNVALYPRSWNVHDSLGEALFERRASGDLERALACYERSLAIEPENDNGRSFVERIRHELAR